MDEYYPRTRREVLGACGGTALLGISGCVAVGDNNADDDQSDDESTSDGNQDDESTMTENQTTNTDNGSRLKASILSTDDVETDVGVDYSVELESSTVGDGETVTAVVTAENTTDEPVAIETGMTVISLRYSDPPDLVMLTDQHDLDAVNTDDCWVLDREPSWEEVIRITELQPGEKQSREFNAVRVREAFEDGCPDPGTYRFADRTIDVYEAGHRDGGDPEDSKLGEVEWGFTMELAEPNC